MRAFCINIILLISSNLIGQSYLASYNVFCEEPFDEEKYSYIDRIIDTLWKSDTFEIVLAKYDNCAMVDTKGDFKIFGDTLFLRYKQKTTPRIVDCDTVEISFLAMCDCPLQFRYRISSLIQKDYIIKLNDEILCKSPDRFKTYPISFVIESGDTINLIDRYRLKQGFWNEFDSVNKINWIGIYKDNDFVNGKSNRFREDFSIESTAFFYSIDSLRVEYYDTSGNVTKIFER